MWLQRRLWEPHFDVKPNYERKRLINRFKRFLYGDESHEVVSRVKKTHIQDLIEEFAQGWVTIFLSQNNRFTLIQSCCTVFFVMFMTIVLVHVLIKLKWLSEKLDQNQGILWSFNCFSLLWWKESNQNDLHVGINAVVSNILLQVWTTRNNGRCRLFWKPSLHLGSREENVGARWLHVWFQFFKSDLEVLW